MGFLNLARVKTAKVWLSNLLEFTIMENKRRKRTGINEPEDNWHSQWSTS